MGDRLVLFCVFGLVISSVDIAGAENSVEVESRVFKGGQDACTTGIFLVNDTPVTGLVIPLEFRELDPGSYISTSCRMRANPLGRLDNSPLGAHNPNGPSGIITRARYAVPYPEPCTGPLAQTFKDLASEVDFIAPDGLMHAAFSISDSSVDVGFSLDTGADPQLTDSASEFLVFGVTTTPGRFVIDTCCSYPANHLYMIDENSTLIPVAFTPGIITISCHADPQCDGYTNVIDVVLTIGRAFGRSDATIDPTCLSHGTTVDGRTDVNCDGVTNVLDVVLSINVAFRAFAPESQFCEACGP